MTLFNRLDCARKSLGALSRCDGVERYSLLLCVEPGCQEVIDFARQQNFAKRTRVIVNEKRLTCPVNVYQALSLAFVESDYNIHIEDDIVLYKDALRYFEHCNVRFKDDQRVLSVSAYNWQESQQCKWHSLAERDYFTPWGWATWKDRWAELKATWDMDYSKGGFDNNINRNVRGDRVEIYPILSRCQNVGTESEHIPSKEWGEVFHKNTFWAGRHRPAPATDWSFDPDWAWTEIPVTDEIREKFPDEWLRAAGKI